VDSADGYGEFLVRLADGSALTINALPPNEQDAVRDRLFAGKDVCLAGITLITVTR